MPGGDGRGPRGQGPMSGRAAGYCAGYAVPGYVNTGGGIGFGGRGRGGGWGRRNWFNETGLTGWQRAAQGVPAFGRGPINVGPYGVPPQAPITRAQELDALKGQAEQFRDALDGIKQRIEELQVEAPQEG